MPNTPQDVPVEATSRRGRGRQQPAERAAPSARWSVSSDYASQFEGERNDYQWSKEKHQLNRADRRNAESCQDCRSGPKKRAKACA